MENMLNHIVLKLILDELSDYMSEKKAYRTAVFLNNIWAKSMKTFSSPFEYVPFPKTFLESVIGTDYYKSVEALKLLNVIEVDDFYCTTNHKSKQYRLNIDKYIIYKQLIISLKTSSCPGPALWGAGMAGSIAFTVRKTPSEKKYFRHKELVIKDLSSLEIDTLNLYEKGMEIASKTAPNFLKSDSFLFDEYVRVRVDSGSLVTKRYGDVYNGAISEGKSLIKNRGCVLMVDAEKFAKTSVINKTFAYSQNISMWHNKMFYADRNSTNYRLDTNMTNTPNVIADEIFFENNLSQIDLRNSQFCILASLLPNEASFKTFKEASAEGELYEYVQDSLGLANRMKSKQMMFELFFSSYKNNGSDKQKLKSIFPSVINWIDTYKKANGSKEFAIMLQKKESEIFIDGVLNNAKRKGIFCLTKHDSVIVKKDEKEYIEKSVKRQLENHGVFGSLAGGS
jgi:hypothetical protein